MILSFDKRFVDKIILGTKIHTIRKDNKGLWKPGNKINFATGVRTKSYVQFYSGTCKHVDSFLIEYIELDQEKYPKVYVNESLLTSSQVEILARNDGFSSKEEFFDWFDSDFEGRIIHWTKFSYLTKFSDSV